MTEEQKTKDWRDEVAEYINMHYQGKKREDIANDLGIARSTLGDILRKRVAAITEQTRAKLYEKTKLECLAKAPESLPQTRSPQYSGIELQLRNLQTATDNIRRLILDSDVPEELKAQARQSLLLTPEHVATRTGDLFYALLEEIEQYKDNPDVLRRLKGSIKPADVGRLSALLSAVYTDDKFKTWVLGSDYKSKGRGG